MRIAAVTAPEICRVSEVNALRDALEGDDIVVATSLMAAERQDYIDAAEITQWLPPRWDADQHPGCSYRACLKPRWVGAS